MIQLQQPPGQVRSQRNSVAANALNIGRLFLFPLVLLVAVLAAFPSLIVGLLLWWKAATAFDRREFWRGLWAAAVFCLICYAVWIWLADPLPGLFAGLLADTARHLWTQAAQVAGSLWLFNLWLAPLLAPIFAGLYPRQFVRPGPLPIDAPAYQYQEEEDQQNRRALAHFERMTASIQDVQPSNRAPVVSVNTQGSAAAFQVIAAGSRRPGEVLGTFQGGELAELVYKGELCLPPSLLELHGVITGEPGAGKTTTLIKLAVIARRYGRRIMYLDLKGSRKTAALFLAAMAALGVHDARVYPLAAYDGWRGDAQALYNKLMQQIDPKSHPFYRAGVGSAIVSLAVKAPAGPPRSSYQFLERLDTDWLKAAYASDPQALREIRDVAPHIGGLALVFSGFFRGISGALDGQWAYEDAPACYIGIDGVAHREEAAILGRYLLDDAAHFASARKTPGEQALLIIDEFGVLESTNATGLYEQVREAGMSVYTSGQSYQSLGRERDALLAASAVKILHRTGAPEPFIRYAGEREVYKFSRSLGNADGEEEDLLHPLANQPDKMQGFMRPDKEYAVRVEDVQQLAAGRVAIIAGGQGGYVQVQPFEIPQALVQAASRFIRLAPRFTPAAPPQLPPMQQQGQGTQGQPKPNAGAGKRKPAAGPTKRAKQPQFSPPAQPPQVQANTQAKPQAQRPAATASTPSQSAAQANTPNPPEPEEELDDFFS